MKAKPGILIVILMVLITQSANAGLVAHWKLDEGSGNSITAQAGASQITDTFTGPSWETADLPSIFGGNPAALYFDGSIPHKIDTSVPGISGGAARTVACWIKSDPDGLANSTFISWGTTANGTRYSFRINGTGVIRLEVAGGYAYGSTFIKDGQWHHVAVSHGDNANVGDCTFYIDGVPEAPAAFGSRTINTGVSNVTIGTSFHNNGSYAFTGVIDDIRIYDHVLTQEEIDQIINAGKATQPSPADGDIDIELDSTLSWTAGEDPNFPGQAAPGITGHFIYLGTDAAAVATAGPDDTTGILRALLPAGDTNYQPGVDDANPLLSDLTYYWRVDERYIDDANSLKGKIWSFDTIKSLPLIDVQPDNALFFEGETASFTVVPGDSATPLSFQWYKGVPGDTSTPIDGATDATMEIETNLDNESFYYCRLTNDAGSTDTDPVTLRVKRLMGYWKFDGNFEDEVGGRTGIGSNAFVDGIDGQAVEFLGTNDIVVVPDSNNVFNFYPDAITVSAWINTTQAGYGAFVAKQRRIVPWQGFLLTHNSNTPIWNIRQLLASGTVTSGSTTVGDGTWHFVVGTFDRFSGVVRLYVDGVLDDEATGLTVRVPKNNERLIFGAEADGSGDDIPYAGLLDDVRIWNYAIDAVEIAKLYNEITGKSVCVENPAYDFDGDCVTTINDLVTIAEGWLVCNMVPQSACP